MVQNIIMTKKDRKRKLDSKDEASGDKKPCLGPATLSVKKEMTSAKCSLNGNNQKTDTTQGNQSETKTGHNEKQRKINKGGGGEKQSNQTPVVTSNSVIKSSETKLTIAENAGEGLVKDVETKKIGQKKTERTARQKHKIMKLKLKRKAKRMGKAQDANKETEAKQEDTKSGKLPNKEEAKAETVPFTKIVLPKTQETISSNWKSLKSVLEKEKAQKIEEIKKKGIPIRPPKKTLVKEDKKNDKESKPDIWFDDVDEVYLDRQLVSADKQKEVNPLVKLGAYTGLTKAVSMDCEMVGVGDGSEDMLARVSIVNQFGEQLYDKFVKPTEKVVDYRTHVSGVRPSDLETGEDFSAVQKEVADILKGRILVGHAILNDLKVLYFSHPRKKVRDTSRYKPFRKLFNGRTPSLKKLTAAVLKVEVQEGEHNSVQDAQATMRLYTHCKQQWEKELRMKRSSTKQMTKT